MTTYPWRYRCPEGHTSIDLSVTVFWCEQCSVSYPKSELVDVAQKADPHV